MSDVLLIDNSIQQDTVLVPVTAVQPDLVTQTDVVVYVPLASKTAHGIVKIGEGLDISSNGVLSFDRSEVTIKEIALNGQFIEPDENKRVNIVLEKKDVGLDNVDNTSDMDKPISNATQRELSRIQGLIKGSENAVSYESYEALVNDFNILGPDVYNVGQSVFIATLKVPDLWIYDIEEEFEEFTYIDDATIESILKIDGTFKVGYYRLAALDTLKVDLSDYVTTEDLDLALTDVAYQKDLPQMYIASATSEDGVLSLTDESGKVITFESKEPDLSGYLPLTAGSDKPVTGDLYIDNIDADKSIFYNAGAQIRGASPGDILISSKRNRNIFLRCDGTSEATTGIRFNRPTGNTVADFYPQTTERVNLGQSKDLQFNNIYGKTIYQNGKQVANADDLSAVTDATLSDDNKTLTVTKRDGSSFDFQGGSNLTNYVTTNTTQTISGAKTFSSVVKSNGGFSRDGSAVFDATGTNEFYLLTSAGGPAYINFAGSGISGKVCDGKYYFGNGTGTPGQTSGEIYAGKFYQNGKQIPDFSLDGTTLTITI